MNILNKLTIKNLKLNKKRTIVTIIGIMLSVALICAVFGMVTSLQATLVARAIKSDGNRHVTIENVSKEDLSYFVNNRHVKSNFLIERLGYAPLENHNEYKPYLYILGYTKEAFANKNINLIKGRLPENNSEIVLSESAQKESTIKYDVGDRITLNIGNRTCSDGSVLNQDNPYYIYDENEIDECHETLTYNYTKEYTIVGIMERPSYNEEPYNSAGYTAITYSDGLSNNYYDISLLFKDPKYTEDFLNTLVNSSKFNNYNYNLNTNLLRWQGAGLSDSNERMIYAIAGVVVSIIILTSIFVIRNSFNISITEKTKQYGMLASIGATSKQIKKNVLYEGLILGLIGIPLGILCGIVADIILCFVVNILLPNFVTDTKFIFDISIIAILLSIALGAITIYLSVISAARKSSKISPIEAIRNNNEIKINSKKLKTPKIIGKLFGVGGQIAYKNLKRSRKKYRTTVISLVVSIAVFISLSSLLNYGFNLSNQYYKDINYNIQLYIPKSTDVTTETKKMLYDDILKLENINSYSLHRSVLLSIDDIVYKTDDAFYNSYGFHKSSCSDNCTSYINIIALGQSEYERFVSSIKENISDCENGAILIDDYTIYVDEQYKHLNVYDLSKNKTFKGTLENGEEYAINIITRTDQKPMGLENVYSESGYLIVSENLINSLDYDYDSLYINSSNPDELQSDIEDYFKDTEYDYSLYNVEEDVRAQKSMLILVAIFLYGFIIVISLIGITNIFNTITTNMNLRSKEFAMLKSIGMTKKEFNKMVNLESIFYGTKSLLIGIPLGLLGSYAIFKAFAVGNDFGFIFPWQAILLAIIVVFLLISVIMHVSIKKINKQNIIETIRNDNI